MAAPRNGFRAHDGGALSAGELQQALQALAEVRAGHVIRVAAEGSVAPAEIRGIFPRVAQAAEALQMEVADSLFAERSGEGVGIELRNATRPGNAANIDEKLHAVRGEDGEKFLDGARGVADGQHR